MRLHQEFLYADAHTESWEAAEKKEAIERIRAFQWESELIAANQLKQCSPTVTIEYPQRKHVLWASVIEKNEELEFLVFFQDVTSCKSKPAERDGFSLRELPNLFELFYRGEFDGFRNALEKHKSSEGAYGNVRRTLTRRCLLFEVGPLIAGFAYSYFYPRNLLTALSVYSVLALINVGRSIKEGEILDRYGVVDSRSKERFDFWLSVVWHTFFPVIILSVRIADIIRSR
jgi:hypothetical protein